MSENEILKKHEGERNTCKIWSRVMGDRIE